MPATASTANGWRMTQCAQRRQWRRVAGLRAKPSRPASIHGPIQPSTTGRSVLATSTATVVTMRPPMPMDLISLTRTMSIAAKPMATAEPDTSTVRPPRRAAWVTASCRDNPSSSPSR